MKTTAWLCAAVGVLLLAGCVVEEHRDVSESRSVELAGVETARITLEMGAGELRLQGGTPKLLDARFDYDVPRWKPVVKSDVSGGRAYVTIRQPEVHNISLGHNRYNWDVSLNDRIPTDLRVSLGAGRGELKLGGASVRRLHLDLGAGELKLDLNGAWDNDLEGSITGGVGAATVRLPRDTGVRVKATGGIGSINVRGLRSSNGYYVNQAYGKSRATLRLEIHGGIGEITLIGG